MKKVYLGLGSNLGDRGRNLQEALVLLERWGVKIVRSSSIYETEPWGYLDQDWFFNMVVEGETELSPEELLQATQAIERALKRVKKIHLGPRTMDIDILFYGDMVMDKPELKIPHHGIADRKSVLVPLNEIAPDFVHPILKKSIGELLSTCSDTFIVNLHD
ncbi:MAG: 2-amino-4-hydroxy-6-hydroxymethyldihydropteridine diphosphokinase [Candidatus Gracilibacteria bacterium]|nr:2-amino-4-hydroxy-6-hydroxymethyldihydropteridine diphosphokinase [Candidatus Peregrinibacteria bacterium]